MRLHDRSGKCHQRISVGRISALAICRASRPANFGSPSTGGYALEGVHECNQESRPPSVKPRRLKPLAPAVWTCTVNTNSHRTTTCARQSRSTPHAPPPTRRARRNVALSSRGHVGPTRPRTVDAPGGKCLKPTRSAPVSPGRGHQTQPPESVAPTPPPLRTPSRPHAGQSSYPCPAPHPRVLSRDEADHRRPRPRRK